MSRMHQWDSNGASAQTYLFLVCLTYRETARSKHNRCVLDSELPPHLFVDSSLGVFGEILCNSITRPVKITCLNTHRTFEKTDSGEKTATADRAIYVHRWRVEPDCKKLECAQAGALHCDRFHVTRWFSLSWPFHVTGSTLHLAIFNACGQVPSPLTEVPLKAQGSLSWF